MAFAEPGNGPEIREPLRREPAERHHIGASPLDLAGGPDPGAVPVEQDPQHQPRIVRRLALRLPEGGVEGLQVEFVLHQLGNEPGQVALGQPLIQGRRHQHHRVRLKVLEPLLRPPFRSILISAGPSSRPTRDPSNKPSRVSEEAVSIPPIIPVVARNPRNNSSAF